VIHLEKRKAIGITASLIAVVLLVSTIAMATIGAIHEAVTIEGHAYTRTQPGDEVVEVPLSAQLQVSITDHLPRVTTYKAIEGTITVNGTSYSVYEGYGYSCSVERRAVAYIELWASNGGETLHLVGKAVAYNVTDEGVLRMFHGVMKIDGTPYYVNATLLTYKISE